VALKVEPRPVTVGLLIADLLENAKREAHAKGLEFETKFDPDLKISADPTLTEAATRNLVDNDIKYTDAGKVRFEIEERESDVVFHIFDTGEGLTPEEVRTIFEPFKRGNTKKPGTGLGLSVTKR